MVHALLECWRVLARDGRLIDVRPIHSNPAIEVVTGDGRIVVGRLIDEAERIDDEAANGAMAEVVRQGFFTPEIEDSFYSASYWETLDGLLAYADRKWSDTKVLAPEVVVQARRQVAGRDGDYRICVRNKIQIRVYNKRESG